MKDGNLVFKAVDGNVCFFPTFGDMMGSCGEPKEGDIISPIMDDDCFKNGNRVKTNVKSCSELRAALPKIEIKNSGIGAYYQIDDYRLDIRWTNPTGGSYSLWLKEKNVPYCARRNVIRWRRYMIRDDKIKRDKNINIRSNIFI